MTLRSGDHRLVLASIGILLALGGSFAATAQPTDVPQPNSPSITSIGWFPAPIQRGYDVIFSVALREDVQPASMELEYCRIENFACAGPLPVEGTPETNYAAVVRWNSTFFSPETRWIGFKVTLVTQNQTVETSPTEHWPQPPQGVPPDAGPFYFVDLVAGTSFSHPGSDTPSVGVFAVGLAAFLVALATTAGRRRP